MGQIFGANSRAWVSHFNRGSLLIPPSGNQDFAVGALRCFDRVADEIVEHLSQCGRVGTRFKTLITTSQDYV